MKSRISKIAIILVTLILSYSKGHSKGFYDQEPKQFYLGLGTGMDYGGLGFKFEYLPIKHLGLYAGAGYNFLGIGLNAGASFKLLPDRRLSPVVMGMYGYNGVISIKGASKYNKTYYGFSAGAGAELKLGERDNTLYFGVFYPFRNQPFHNDYDAVIADRHVFISQDLLPVTFSVGFNFSL